MIYRPKIIDNSQNTFLSFLFSQSGSQLVDGREAYAEGDHGSCREEGLLAPGDNF
jgi:hypothetical protein